ncbi:MAG: helix-turn-helix domain-containing protein [Bradyrhizobium sp.]|nr:helix-turn-helix domain-containing protein [Bradyrhizobium sp.]
MRHSRIEDDVVTLGAVAKALGIARTTAYVRARAGELAVQWRGGRYEMRRADLDQLVREGVKGEHHGAAAPHRAA